MLKPRAAVRAHHDQVWFHPLRRLENLGVDVDAFADREVHPARLGAFGCRKRLQVLEQVCAMAVRQPEGLKFRQARERVRRNRLGNTWSAVTHAS